MHLVLSLMLLAHARASSSEQTTVGQVIQTCEPGWHPEGNYSQVGHSLRKFDDELIKYEKELPTFGENNTPESLKECNGGCERTRMELCDTLGGKPPNLCSLKHALCWWAKVGKGWGLAHFGRCHTEGCNKECHNRKCELCDSRGQTHLNHCNFAKAACQAREKGQIITAVANGPCGHENVNQENCCTCQCDAYRGKQTTTVSGAECKPWRQLPSNHYYHPDNNPNAGLNFNYCRNPSTNYPYAWCYIKVKGPGEPDWEDCDVPKCVSGNDWSTCLSKKFGKVH